MNMFLFYGIISVIIFLLDIKYGIFHREFLLGIRSYENDHMVTVGNLLMAVFIFFAFGFNIAYSVMITLMALAVFLEKLFRRFSIKKFLSKQVF